MYKTSTAYRQSPNDGAAPLPVLTPFWLAMPGAHHGRSAVAGLSRVATEWLSFVCRRLGEDARLAGQLATSRSPAEFWGRYAEFLQTAMQDYWHEYVALTKLATENVDAGLERGCEPRTAEATEEQPVARAA
jgi:hypothetical protein